MYVDGTVGGGGQSVAILDARIGTRVIAIDRDRDSLPLSFWKPRHYERNQVSRLRSPQMLAVSQSPATGAGLNLDSIRDAVMLRLERELHAIQLRPASPILLECRYNRSTARLDLQHAKRPCACYRSARHRQTCEQIECRLAALHDDLLPARRRLKP